MKIHKPRKMMSRTERAALIFGLVMLLLGVIIGISIRILAAEPSEITITEMSSTQKETQKTKEETGNESQAGDESQIQPCFESETLEGIQPEIQAGAQSEAQTQVAAKNMDSESEGVSEQTASEETPTAQPSRQEEVVEEVTQSSPAEAEAERPTEAAAVYTQTAPLYLVEGEQLDPGVAEYLYQRLCEAGIGWFYEYALCLAYQESSFNPLAENVNGRDKGLYQFRVEFHPGLAWQNPYAQTDLFVSMMAARAAAGCDAYSMISRHNTSDYCPEINPVYLTQVLSHLPTLQRIR